MQSSDSWAAAWPPLTLSVLAAYAEKKGETAILDCNIGRSPDEKELTEIIRNFSPHLIVINTAFPSIENDAAIAQRIRNAFPKAKLAGIGAPFTLLKEKAFIIEEAYDAAIYGEPEITFSKLLDRIIWNESFEGLKGLIWNNKGITCVEPPRPFIRDLDILPFPARKYLQNEDYVLPLKGRKFTLVNTARGCPGSCSFCIAPLLNGKKVRRHSTKYILEEILQCVDFFGIRDFLFWEESFTRDRNAVMELCEELKNLNASGAGISWAATTRADLVDREMLKEMKSSGLFLLGMGIESGCSFMLEKMAKNLKPEQSRKAVKLCREIGIVTMGHFIVGMPGESTSSADRSLRFALSLGLDYLQCYTAVPYPGTLLAEEVKRQGLAEAESFNNFDLGGKSLISTDIFSSSSATASRDRMYRKFYLRPGFILRKIRHLAANPRKMLEAAGFLNWIIRRKTA